MNAEPPTVLTNRPGLEDVVFRSNNSVWWATRPESATAFSSSPKALGLTNTAGPPEVVARATPDGTHIDDIYVRMHGGALMYTSLDADTGQIATPIAIPGIVASTDPTVVATAASYPRERIYVSGAQNILMIATYNVSTNTATAFTSLTVPSYDKPTVVPRFAIGGPDADDIYVRSVFGAILHNTGLGWSILNATAPALSRPVAAASVHRGTIENLYYQGATSQFFELSVDVATGDVATAPHLLSLPATGVPAVVVRSTPTGDVDDVWVRSIYGGLVTNRSGAFAFVGGSPLATDPAVVAPADRAPAEDVYARDAQNKMLLYTVTNPPGTWGPAPLTTS